MTGLFPDAPASPISLDEQIAEVEREIRMREKVFPRWVAEKKMQQHKADRLMEIMRTVLQTLKSLKEKTT